MLKKIVIVVDQCLKKIQCSSKCTQCITNAMQYNTMQDLKLLQDMATFFLLYFCIFVTENCKHNEKKKCQRQQRKR